METMTQYIVNLKSDKLHGRFMGLAKMFLHEKATPDFQNVILRQMQMVQCPPTVMNQEDAEIASQHGCSPGQIIVKKV